MSGVSLPTQGKYFSGCIGAFELAVIANSSPGMIAQLGICKQENLSNFIVDLPYCHVDWLNYQKIRIGNTSTASYYVTNHNQSEMVALI